MEGYMNVGSSHHNFDDLDIEGYNEWNAGDEDYSKKVKNGEEKSVLEAKVQLDDGKFANMCSVVEKDRVSWYTCHVCTVTVAGWPQFFGHIKSKLHANNVNVPTHPRAKFAKLDPKEKLSLEPGEPVPPGLEEVIISTCEIQRELDAYTTGPLIGLEYLVELTNNSEDPLEYFCLLCDRRGNNRNIMVHLTSQSHYMKYISQFFRTAAQKLADIPKTNETRKGVSVVIVRIASRIESKFGRLKPVMEPLSTFPARKFEILRTVDEGIHFRETDDDTFADCIDLEEIKSLAVEEYRPPDQTLSSTKLNQEAPVETPPKSLFNKGRIGADKRQLRVRNESSPVNAEVITVDDTPPSSPGKKPRLHSSLSSISQTSSSPTRSKSRSKSRGRSRSRSRSHGHRRPAYDRTRAVRRSRSDSRHRRRYRSRSLSKGRRRFSRSRSRSSERHRRRYRHRSPFASRKRSPPVPAPYRGDASYSRNRSRRYPDSPPEAHRDRSRRSHVYQYDYNEEKSEGRLRYSKTDVNSEKYKWEKFREDFKKMETEMYDKLKYYEKNPEKHPRYPEEWKAFWNRRYKELKAAGRDPAKHDFKPEWITFWNKRMRELHDEDLKKKKEDLKEKLCLPKEPAESRVWVKNKPNASPLLEDVSPPTPSKKDAIEDIKNTWKALTGSDIKDGPKRPLSPWEEEPGKSKEPGSPDRKVFSKTLLSPSEGKSAATRGGYEGRSREAVISRDKGNDDLHVISVLRQVTVLENHLGSLGPKVVDLLSKALALERVRENGSRAILLNDDDCMLLETVKEKMKGNLFAGVVARNMVNTTRSAISKIECLLQEAPRKDIISQPLNALISQPISAIVSHSLRSMSAIQKRDPVVVPGVGTLDKVAIAEQIAKALVVQGKTDVTEAELEQLINAVVGMTQASVNSAQTMTAAAYLAQVQAYALAPTPATTLATENKSLALTVPQPADGSTASGSLKLLQPLLDENVKKAVSSDTKPVISDGTINKPVVSDVTINRPVIPDISIINEKNPVVLDTAGNKPGIPSLKRLEVYKSPVQEEDEPKTVHPAPMEDLSEADLRNLLQNYSELPRDEQIGLTNYLRKLETTSPEKIKILQPLITPDILPPKKIPISIPLLKQKSEQKVKPVNSGRLSPFSMRMGGINPTADELDDEIRNDDVVELKSSTKSLVEEENVKTSDTKNKNDDDDDDKYGDDDDDVDEYSFEDVYKAASEKVRLKQLEENKKKEEMEKEKKKSLADSKQFSVKDSNIVIPPAELFESILGKVSGSMPPLLGGSEQNVSESNSQSLSSQNNIYSNIPLLQNTRVEKSEYQVNLSNYSFFSSHSSNLTSSQTYSGTDQYNSTNSANSYMPVSQNYSQTATVSQNFPDSNSSNVYSNQMNTSYSNNNYSVDSARGIQSYPIQENKSSVLGSTVHNYPQNSATNSYMPPLSSTHMNSDRGMPAAGSQQGYDRGMPATGSQQGYNRGMPAADSQQGYDPYPQQHYQQQVQQTYQQQQYGGKHRGYDDYPYNNSNSYSGQYGRQNNSYTRPRQGYSRY